MEKDVIVIPAKNTGNHPANGSGRERLRVAAYCRVSTEEEQQLGSFENQIDNYTRQITGNKNYELVRIYSDEGISGCSTKSRKGFRALIEDCEAGLIDLVITKSISRFARNTQDSLNYTRKLRDMGIGIYFEKEGISTLESSGELLLTLFSCFAQEESRSISENTAWGIRSRFKQGIPHLNVKIILGYEKDEEGRLVIFEEQAVTVRRIYRMFLEGFSLHAIADVLNCESIPGVRGEPRWCATTITRLLENEKYKGSMLMQKTYTTNYLTKRHARNTGQLEQYYIEQNHPAIIDPEEWEAVQQEIARRREFRKKHRLRDLNGGRTSAFQSRFFCRKCASSMQWVYRRGMKTAYWLCECCGRKIQNNDLRERFCEEFNRIVEEREKYLSVWMRKLATGTALEKVRARQMIEITAGGKILYEVPELTRAILQEAWVETGGQMSFILHADTTVNRDDIFTTHNVFE